MIRKSVSIEAPVDRVFDYLTDPTHFPDIWPSLLEVDHVSRHADGSHSFDWVYKMAGLKFRGHAETIELQKNRLIVAKAESGIPSTFRWTYDGSNGSTHLTLEIEYSLPTPVLKRFAEPIIGKLNEHEAEALLKNLKATMEA
jgi:uncharacterized membrane protein